MQGVVQRKTFINGFLAMPGQVVDIDERIFVAPERTTLSNREKNSNVRYAPGGGPVEAAPVVSVPIAAIGPHADGATRPQGLPAGTVPVGDSFLTPGDPASGVLATAPVAATVATDPAGIGATMQAQADQAHAQRKEAEARAEQQGKLDPDTLSRMGGGGQAGFTDGLVSATEAGLTGTGGGPAAPHSFGSMTKGELEDYADKNGIEFPEGVKTRDQMREFLGNKSSESGAAPSA